MSTPFLAFAGAFGASSSSSPEANGSSSAFFLSLGFGLPFAAAAVDSVFSTAATGGAAASVDGPLLEASSAKYASFNSWERSQVLHIRKYNN